MLLQKELNQLPIKIKGYQPGEINVSGNTYQSPILLTGDELKLFELAEQFSDFKIDTFLPLIPEGTEIIIIGCGEKQQFLATKEMKKFHDQGIAIEVMCTRQACHTFEVLIYDKRKVMALLFP